MYVADGRTSTNVIFAAAEKPSYDLIPASDACKLLNETEVKCTSDSRNTSADTGGTSDSRNTSADTGGTSDSRNTSADTGGTSDSRNTSADTGGTSDSGNTSADTGGTSDSGNTSADTEGNGGEDSEFPLWIIYIIAGVIVLAFIIMVIVLRKRSARKVCALMPGSHLT